MLKLRKFIAVSMLSLALILTVAQQSYAWRWFGRETVNIVSQPESPDCLSITTYYTTYFFGIDVGSGSETETVCN
jgi:hypothetical protein